VKKFTRVTHTFPELFCYCFYIFRYLKGVKASACKGKYNRNSHWNDFQLRMRKDTELLDDKKFLWEDS